jgi:ECF sigma factor
MNRDITSLLEQWAGGDANAFKALMPIVYDELRQLAEHYLREERRDHTLQPTALVHEAYLRLAGIRDMRLKRPNTSTWHRRRSIATGRMPRPGFIDA